MRPSKKIITLLLLGGIVAWVCFAPSTNDVAVELGPLSQPTPTRLVGSIALVARSRTRVYLDTGSLRNFHLDVRERASATEHWQLGELDQPKTKPSLPASRAFIALKKGESYRVEIVCELTALPGDKIDYNWGEMGRARLSQKNQKRLLASFNPSSTYASDSIEYIAEGIALP